MLFKTKGSASPKGKPKAFFTCHPSDGDRCFDSICDDIFKTHDVAIYYLDDGSNKDEDDTLFETDLRQMSLFLVPVSFKLLTESCFAKEYALPFAKKEHIPILPIMLEPGLDSIYAKGENFGNLQYLDPYAIDLTAISYEKKLADYLNSVLIGGELAGRVRKAFDTYVFLSYRKKDRAYANDLMRLIHKDPLCRDIAIWYDEFLTPGESFDESIAEAMDKSDLFALLVTPNLVNEKNYVQTEEYPRAKDINMRILPVEMVATDRNMLEKQYPGIPECVSGNDEDKLRTLFLKNLSRIAKAENSSDPLHNYLIGLAYLDGIDVEVDKSRAVDLIRGSADSGLLEAMEKIADMYEKGIGVERNLPMSLEWYERFVNLYEEKPDHNVLRLLSYQNILATVYNDCGQYDKAIDLSQKVYEARKHILGETNPNTLTSLNNLAKEYSDKDGLINHERALELHKRIYEIRKCTLGENHPETITSLDNLAYEYGKVGNHNKALELHKQAYGLRKTVLGDKDPYTLTSLNNLASEYENIGSHKKAVELFSLVYELRQEVLGKDHPATLRSLNNLAYEYSLLGDHKNALDWLKQVYESFERVLGKSHPDTLSCLSNLANEYGELGNHKKAIKLLEEASGLYKDLLGDDHPLTLKCLNNLSVEYGKTNRFDEALALLEVLYESSKQVLGADNTDTLSTLNNLAFAYESIGNHEQSLELLKKLYTLCVESRGENHLETISALHNLAYVYGNIGNSNKVLELKKRVYESYRRILGSNHPDTLTSLNNLANTYAEIGDSKMALSLFEDVYVSSRNNLGENHLDTLKSLHNLATLYSETGDHKKALKLFKRLYESCLLVLGDDHPLTYMSLKSLAVEYGTVGNLVKSKELFDKLMSMGLRRR